MKRCTKCKQLKPRQEFSKDKSRGDGLQYSCKECNAAWSSSYYAANRGTYAIRAKKNYANNHDNYLAVAAAWRKANPEHAATKRANRRVKEKLSKEQRAESTIHRKRIKYDRCYYCEQWSSVMHYDHVIPLSRGGTDHYWNIVRACATCNLRKGNKTDLEYIAMMPLRGSK